MTAKTETIGLLLMAYGSPEDLGQIKDYLLDVRGGRPPSAELIEEISERYKKIGGRSPLLDRTQEQAAALENELNKRFADRGEIFKAFVGMRHWQPRIFDAVEQMVKADIRRAVAIVMAPHSSHLSTGMYYAALEKALAGKEIEFLRIQSWHKHPGLLKAIAEKMEIGLAKFGNKLPYVIFTAHSLPSRILDADDPYDSQLNETAQLLAHHFKLPDKAWRFCYQSAGASPVPWLGPPLEEVIREVATKGKKSLLVVPIGFVCDHVEVLYDIDIEARQVAEQYGARLERSPSLNASSTFVAALADLVQENLFAE